MKHKIYFFLILFVFQFSGQIAYAHIWRDQEIQILHKERILVAPFAESYQWYYNGVQISETGQKIEIDKPGNYSVRITDEYGINTEFSISVGINSKGEAYKIFLIGDSTVANYTSGYYPQKGWGQMFQYFFDSTVVVDNRAVGGTSAKSFYNYFWPAIKAEIQPGDYVLIQFGINDAKSDDTSRYTIPFTTFKEYLTKYVNETKTLGGVPVLVATVRRNAWNATIPPTVYDAYHDYPVATRQLAGEISVPLIDLDQLAVPLMEGLGPDYTGPYMYLRLDPGEYPNYPSGKTDDVHFQEMGAIEYARLAIEAIETYTTDTNLNKLIPHIKQMHEVAVSTNFPDGAIITRTASYPEGIPVTIKAKVDPAYDLLEWQNGSGAALTTADRYQFTMGNGDMSLIAILDDDPVPDCAGVYNGGAYYDNCGICVGGNTRKYPCYIDFEDDTFKIVVEYSGLCVEETLSEKDGKKYITQELCADNPHQSWIFTKNGDNYSIKNLASDSFIFTSNLIVGSYLIPSLDEHFWTLERIVGDTFKIAYSDSSTFIAALIANSTKAGVKLVFSNRKGSSLERFIIYEDDINNCIIYPDICSNGNIDIKTPSPFSFSPNPFQDQVLLTNVHYNTPYSLSLYTIEGRQLISRKNIMANEYFFGNELDDGIYIVKVIQDNQVWIFRIIKK